MAYLPIDDSRFDLSLAENKMMATSNSNWAANGETAVDASGGTETVITVGADTYRVHTFTSVGTSTLTVTYGGLVEYLIVAGGGGGSKICGGGGGAGGMLTGTAAASIGANSIVVGGGGAGGGAAGGHG